MTENMLNLETLYTYRGKNKVRYHQILGLIDIQKFKVIVNCAPCGAFTDCIRLNF